MLAVGQKTERALDRDNQRAADDCRLLGDCTQDSATTDSLPAWPRSHLQACTGTLQPTTHHQILHTLYSLNLEKNLKSILALNPSLFTSMLLNLQITVLLSNINIFTDMTWYAAQHFRAALPKSARLVPDLNISMLARAKFGRI